MASLPDAAEKASALEELASKYSQWLYLKDASTLYVLLASYVANRADGDPLWTLIVGASGGGKTEQLAPLAALQNAHSVSTLTEAGLLSGSPNREVHEASTGGILRAIGDYGIILLKDFTSVLSMNRESRSAVLAALREIYDGYWKRDLGSDGGKTLEWRGKLGFIGACTAAIDGHHEVMATMGERFILWRLPEVDAIEQAKRALKNSGSETIMRAELEEAVKFFFDGLDIPEQLPDLDHETENRIASLATLIAHCRSAVERNSHSRDIELVLDTEAPARLAKSLGRLYRGLMLIGLTPAEATRILCKTGLDCMPKIRRLVFDVLAGSEQKWAVSSIADLTGYPLTTVRRALEDMSVHNVTTRQRAPEMWKLTDKAWGWYETAFESGPVLSDQPTHT